MGKVISIQNKNWDKDSILAALNVKRILTGLVFLPVCCVKNPRQSRNVLGMHPSAGLIMSCYTAGSVNQTEVSLGSLSSERMCINNNLVTIKM